MPPEVLAAHDRKMGMLIGLLPGIGNGLGIIEAISDKDMNNEPLSPLERALSGLADMVRSSEYISPPPEDGEEEPRPVRRLGVARWTASQTRR
ncbi:hypothetical protein ACWGAN_17815 [Streptomyces sp. NPDC054945]